MKNGETMNAVVDVAFAIKGKSIPLDHGYALFGSVSRVLPRLHEEASWGIHPVYGRQVGKGELALLPQSLLTIRVPSNEIGQLLALSGQSLNVDGHMVVVGVPKVFQLKPRPLLKARFVTIKKFDKEPAEFCEAVRRQLDLIEVGANAIVAVGPRRVIRVGSHIVVGFVVGIDGLTADESIRVQEKGIGGRRHMGAGMFLAPNEVAE
jgi:CRISPR-associated protein Cas6